MNPEIEEYVRMGRRELPGTPDELRAEAISIEKMYGPRMLSSMVAWLYDPGKRENPLDTKQRFDRVMTDPNCTEVAT